MGSVSRQLAERSSKIAALDCLATSFPCLVKVVSRQCQRQSGIQTRLPLGLPAERSCYDRVNLNERAWEPVPP